MFTWESGEKIEQMDMELTIGLMETGMMESGAIARRMGKELISFLTEILIWANI